MRFNRYPRVEEFQNLPQIKKKRKTPEDIREAIENAITRAELLTEETIRMTPKIMRMTLGKGLYLLPDFPVHKVKIEGLDLDRIEVDRLRGVVVTKAFDVDYTVSYETGHREGELPSHLVVLITKLTESELLGQDLDAAELEALVKTAKMFRLRREQQRHGLEDR